MTGSKPLVARLRARAEELDGADPNLAPDASCPDAELLDEACDEIERLRAALERVCNVDKAAPGRRDCDIWAEMLAEAAEALRTADETPAAPTPMCTCTPPKFESGPNWGSYTSGVRNPTCKIHWRETLIQNGVITSEETSAVPMARCQHERVSTTLLGGPRGINTATCMDCGESWKV